MKLTWISSAALTAAIWIVSCQKPGNPSQYLMGKVDYDFLAWANTALNNQIYIQSYIIDSTHFAYPNGTPYSSALYGYTFPIYREHKPEHAAWAQLAAQYLHTTDSMPDAEHIALLNEMKTVSGRAFDSIYIVSQEKDHQDMIDKFTFEGNFGLNDSIKKYASMYLVTEYSHQRTIPFYKSQMLK